jgi:hypothetical protein
MRSVDPSDDASGRDDPTTVREGNARASTFDREAVDRLLDDLPDTQEFRPAVGKLTQDQRGVVAEFVDGFRSRRGFVRWSQRAALHTLGSLSGDWFVERVFSGPDMAALLTSRDREAWVDAPPDLEAAARQRRAVAAVDVLPACLDAVRALRWNATEYVNDRDDDLQPDADLQKHPAMRPALSEMDEKQGWAIRHALDGFDSEDAFLTWASYLAEASFAESDRDLATRVLVDEPHTKRMVIRQPRDDSDGPFFRESWAAVELLPAFATAAREVVDKAGELAEGEKKDMDVTRL